MLDKFGKYFVVLSGLTPIILICWVIQIIQEWNNLSIYFDLSSRDRALGGILNLIITNWLLILFLCCLLVTRNLLNYAIKIFSPIEIEVKTLKSAEVNFTPVLFSVLAGWLKYYFSDVKDYVFLVGTTCICFVYALVFRDSYHYNIVYKLFFGYRHYEVQIGNVTYLFLSKSMIYDTKEITSGIKLADYMIINTTNN